MTPAVSFPQILLLTVVVVIVFSEIIKVAVSLLLSVITTVFTAFFRDLSRILSPLLFRTLNIIDLISLCAANIAALAFSVTWTIIPWFVSYILLKSLLWDRSFFSGRRTYALNSREPQGVSSN
ncbi:hypothetical protein F5Y05DRAFT_96945 [Hypoxylon sp. FL0543]|nr:hypothetical protein F5Y05DRAFT_96945 [Hypoxylon sp. FL0543]